MSKPEYLSLLTVPPEYFAQPMHNAFLASDLEIRAVAGIRFQFDPNNVTPDWLMHRDFDRLSHTLSEKRLLNFPLPVAERLVGFFNNRFVDPDAAVGMQHSDESFVRYVAGFEAETVDNYYPTHKYNFGENVDPEKLRAGGAYALRPLIEEIEQPPITFLAIDDQHVVTTYGFGHPLVLTTTEELLAFHPSINVAPIIAKPIT